MREEFEFKTFNIDRFRKNTRIFYRTKYYNLFMNLMKWENIDYKQIDFLMKILWHEGKIACFKIPYTESEDNPNGIICFTPWAPVTFDTYDFPIMVQLINRRGVSFIPSKLMEVDENVVIGYSLRSKSPFEEYIYYLIDKLVEVEVLLKVCEISLKCPWLISTTPENERKLKELFNRVMNGNPVLFLTAEEKDAFSILQMTSQFYLDKIYSYKQQIENEILTAYGINNMGIGEKKEHLITTEVESNNHIIESSGNSILDMMKEFATRINEVLDYPINVELRNKPMESKESKESKESEDEENEDVTND